MRIETVVVLAAACGGAGGAASGQSSGAEQRAIAQSPTSEGAHRVNVNGAELAYEVHGTGPFAIAIAGGPGFGAAYLRMPEVEKHLSVIYVDLVGTGASERLADPTKYGRPRDVADIEAFRRTLGLDRVIVIGHSYGGFVALEHVLEHPEAVAGLVLYDTSPMTGEEWMADVGANMQRYQARPWFQEAAAAFASARNAGSDEEINALFPKLAPFYIQSFDADPARWNAFFASAKLSAARFKAPPVPYDVRARLAEIKVPTLVLVGAGDFICSPRMAAILDDKIPSSTLVTFVNSGHFAHVEEPVPFAQAVARFAASLPVAR